MAKTAKVFFVLLTRGFGDIKIKHPPKKLSPQYYLEGSSILHQLALGLKNARELLQLICVTGLRFQCVGLRMDCWIFFFLLSFFSPLSQICKSPLSLDLIVGKTVKIILPHLRVPAVLNSWESQALGAVPRANPPCRLMGAPRSEGVWSSDSPFCHGSVWQLSLTGENWK